MKRQAMALERWMIRGRGDEGITMCGKKNHVNKGAETGRAGGETARTEGKKKKLPTVSQSQKNRQKQGGRLEVVS